MKISVKSIHFSADTKLIRFVEEKLNRLEKIFDRIAEVEVHLKLQDTGGKVREKIAEIHLHVPGGWIIDKKTGKSFETAVNAAFDTLKRQVSRHKEKVKDHPKSILRGGPAIEVQSDDE